MGSSQVCLPNVQPSNVLPVQQQTQTPSQNLPNGLKFLQPQAPQVQEMSPEQRNIENFRNKPKTNQFEQMAAQQGVPVLATGPEMTEATKRTGRTRVQRGGESTEKESVPSVYQELKFVDKEGKTRPLHLALIDILDSDNNIVKACRTDPKGRWIAPLAPGSYTIHAQKSAGVVTVDHKYSIVVNPSSKPINLGEKVIQ
jgi:hypothetical protein